MITLADGIEGEREQRVEGVESRTEREKCIATGRIPLFVVFVMDIRLVHRRLNGVSRPQGTAERACDSVVILFFSLPS